MSNPKRVIQADAVKAGDSVREVGIAGLDVWFVYKVSSSPPWIELSMRNHEGDGAGGDYEPTDEFVVGFTDRKAKRQRGKMRRRARFAAAREARQ